MGQKYRVKVWDNCAGELCRVFLDKSLRTSQCMIFVFGYYWLTQDKKIWDSLEMFLNLHNIIVNYSSEDDTMFTLDNHEPAYVIFTLFYFYNVVNPHSYLREQCSDTC